MSGNSAIAETRSGKLEGRYNKGVFEFRGVPYAAPPEGSFRWLPPQPVKPWAGVRQAVKYGNIAPQNPLTGIFEGLTSPVPQDEDCLFLNIWTPALDNGRRPVLVWIHGGAFNLGSGAEPLYKGNRLASYGNAVVITINYRLGMLGFLNLKEITGGRIPATGNEGLMDQMTAIAWVRDNIEAFGGDPGNITVFGESAGAMSISCMLGMRSSKGLFRRAILESGGANEAMPLESAVKLAEEFLKIAGLKPGDIDAIQKLPVKELLAAEMALRVRRAAPGEAARVVLTSPVIDGEVIHIAPLKAIQNGSAAGIPLLLGSNLDEYKFFRLMESGFHNIDEDLMMKRLQFFISPEYIPEIVNTYREARAGRGDSNDPQELLSAILSDFMFRIPVLDIAEAQKSHGVPVYNYLFTWKSPAMEGTLGSCHTLEVGFVFGNYNEAFHGAGPAADALSKNMQDSWIAFASGDNPGCESLGTWPQYGDKRHTMILGEESAVLEAPYEIERKVWDRLPKN